MITQLFLKVFLGKWNLYGHASIGSIIVFASDRITPLYVAFLVGSVLVFAKEVADYNLDGLFDHEGLLYGWVGVALTTLYLCLTPIF
jgi:hypothetical protein